MQTYTLKITQMTMTMHEGRLKGARRYMRADGLQIYVVGAVGKKRDTAINLCINKALECGHRAIEVKWW